MYLEEIQASADKEIVERFRDGFFQRFMRHCESICGPYSKLLYRKVRTNDVKKIDIDFSDRFRICGDEEAFYPLPIRWYFDINSYVSESEALKRRHILASVHAVCQWCVKRMGWEQKPFQEAFEALVAVDCKWTYFAKVPVWNPKKNLRVQLSMQLDLEEFVLRADILSPRSRSVLTQIEIGRVRSQCSNNYGIIPELVWLSSVEFKVSSYVVNVETGHVTKSTERWWLNDAHTNPRLD